MPNATGVRSLGDLFGLFTWQRLVTVADYAPPLSLLIHQLKFSRRSEIASALSRLLLLEVLHARRTTGLQLPDRIISVPLWQRRHWRR